MALETVEPSTLVPELPVDVVEAPPEDSSVAAHAASFGPAPKVSPALAPTPEPVVDEPKPRHRATSQQATAEDVVQINALTKELRTKEAELAKARPEALSGSPRLIALKRQIKAIEAELGERQPAATPAPVAPVKPPVSSSTSTFTEAEPLLDAFISEPDPYAAYLRAVGRYDRRKEDWEAGQTRQAEQVTQATQATIAAYQKRVTAFKATHPDYETVINAAGKDVVPPALHEAILSHDKGPDFVYYLGQHPEFFDEMLLMTDGRPITDQFVALVQRRLAQRVQAVSTGSAAPRPAFTSAARPPNPVRTGPMHTGDDPPGDGHSLAEHSKFYGPKSRR